MENTEFQEALHAMEGPAWQEVKEDVRREQSREAFRAAVERLALLDVIEYDLQRKKEAKTLGVRVKTLDATVKKLRQDRDGRKSSEHQNSPPVDHTGTATSECSVGRSVEGSDGQENGETLYRKAKELIEHPDPIAVVAEAMRALGYAGDLKPPLLVYLAGSSRFQQRPLNVFLRAQSASGKNRTIDAALDLVPAEAFHKISACSPRALVYSSESFKNRVIVLCEMDSVPEEGTAASALRAIAEDAAMHYEVVEQNPETNQYETRTIVKEGPTGLVTSGTRPFDRQMATRMLTVTLSDSAEQTREILRAKARAVSSPKSAPTMDIDRFHAFQRWLAVSGEKRVVVPFAEVLADLVPAKSVRMRRDFAQLLSVVMTFAFLAQQQRSRASDGAVAASLEDYAHAREHLAPIFDSVQADGLTPAVRATVEAVQDGETVSAAELEKRLDLAKSTISDRVRGALKGGWLVNEETKKGFPYQLRRGVPLPEALSALPTVEEVRAAFDPNTIPNVLPNTHQPPGKVRQTDRVFGCSVGNTPHPHATEENLAVEQPEVLF